MQPEKLNYVRELRERTQHNAGIILAGVPYFYARPAATRERDGVPELLSRVGGKRMPPAPTKRELVDVAEANGIGRDVMQARAERWCGPARIPDAGPLDSQAAGTSGPAGRNR